MAKKSKKGKIPKKVGTVKIPKNLRKAGDKAMKLAQNPVIGDIVAAGLLAAAAALTKNRKLQETARELRDDAGEAASAAAARTGQATTTAKSAMIAVGEALRDELLSDKSGKGGRARPGR